MDFKFPGGYPGEAGHQEAALNNHYLVNESLKSDQEHSDHDEAKEEEEEPLITSVASNTTSTSSPSKPNNINADSSNGYYSFANISDNTTSPSFVHHADSSESNDDMISMLHINSQYPHTLAPKKNGNEATTIDSTSSFSPHKKQSVRSLATHTNTIPTADNMSYDIISSESLYRVNSAKLDSLRLPSSSSSSNISSRASLLHGSATVKRTPMNLYRKPTMRKIESVVFSSDGSEASDNGVPNPTAIATNTASAAVTAKTTNTTKKTANKSRIPSKHVHSNINKTKDLPSKPIRRMSSMRANPKSNLKRSNAVRCHGGLLQYFEMIGIQIKKLIKQIKLLFFKKKTTTTYQSKNFTSRRSSSFNTTTALPIGNSSLQNKRLRNGKVNNTKIPKSRVQSANKLKVSHHIPNSSSLQALQPALIEKVNPIKPVYTTVTNNNRVDPSVVPKSKEQEDNGHKMVMESTLNSPIISGATSNAATSVTASANQPSTRTNSTLRRTNSSIRRAASILTASSPSTTTYYSTMTHPENDSPMRRSKLIKSNGSTSLNSLVRQPSIVVKNKVIPLSMSQQYSTNDNIKIENDMDSKINMESHEGFETGRLLNKYTSPMMDASNIDAFDTIKEEDEDDDEKRNVSCQSQSDSGSSIFMQLETTTDSMDHHDTEPEDVDDIKQQQVDDDEYAKRQETMRQLMKAYLSQIIEKRVLMRLQMTKFQTTDVMDDHYKEMIGSLVTENEDESDTSSVASSDNDSMRFSHYNATSDVHSSSEEEEDAEDDEDARNDKISPLAMQYPSKDIEFGMRTLFASNRDKVMNIPTSTIKRSMTLPIGMKI